MLKWSIATVSMGGTLEAKLAAAARAGFRSIEIFENDLTFFSGRPRDVRSMAENLGLEIIAFQPMRDFEGMPEPQRTRNFERARRKFDLMEELGASLLCVCSNVADNAIGDPARAAEDLGALADIALQRGFRVGYEALAWGKYVHDWMQAYDIVQRANRPNLGVVLDSFHICARKNPIAPLADIKPEHIALVQLADAPGIVMDVMSLSRHHRCFPAQGDFPLTDYLEAILKTGYRGPISLEIFNDQFRGAPATVIARDGMRSLQITAEKLEANRKSAGQQPLTASAALPAPAKIGGIEFIEFATSSHESEALTSLLEGLGFTLVGRHRSKDVDLYRQNDINIVVNREQDGFAHSFYLVHGTSVCALTLRFDDAKRALERANSLAGTTYFGRVGPGEAVIPAVGGVENSLIYFVDDKPKTKSNWDQDFIFEGNPAPRGSLDRFDHLSNVVRRSEFLSWILFYKAILGFRDEPQVELADPYGAFFSRVISSPDGSVRIPLNIAEGGSTGVSRFIDSSGGGGIQQIALSTVDLFTFVEAARERGVRFLDIPDNYYDDIEARYDLPADTLDRMRELKILYDRTQNGEFFHIYTSMFEDRFFFEILERRNYDLFGAANTPVRLAAQTREQDLAQQQKAMFEY
jgi:4-hydroxyphenylpyruvate dioxygenase